MLQLTPRTPFLQPHTPASSQGTQLCRRWIGSRSIRKFSTFVRKYGGQWNGRCRYCRARGVARTNELLHSNLALHPPPSRGHVWTRSRLKSPLPKPLLAPLPPPLYKALYNTVPQGNGEEDYEEIDADDEASIAAAAAAAAAASPARSRPSGGRGGGGSNDAAAHSTAPTNGRASAASRTTTTPRGGDGNGRTFALSRNTTLRGAETGDIDKQFAAIRKEKWNWWKQFGVVTQ